MTMPAFRVRLFSFTPTLLLLTLTLLIGSDPLMAQATCGDALIHPGEECEDGNLMPGDGCSASCRLEICGNGVIDFGETCDDSNLQQYNDGCIQCIVSLCGNGIVEPGEFCDDGNQPGGCNAQCSPNSCMSDAECADGIFCNGIEVCQFAQCYPGTAVGCADMGTCTQDFCQESADVCRHIVTGDVEIAAARDGRCQTIDDNLPLFGTDGNCGSMDDYYGDGVCAADDTCPTTWNASQTDSDADGLGDACDGAPCASLSAYVTDQSGNLLRFNLSSGESTLVASGFSSSSRGMEINGAETTAWLAEWDYGRIQQVSLPGGSSTEYAQGLSSPWGLIYDSSQSRLYVTEESSGELSYIGGMGVPITVRSGLSQPRGVAMGFNSNVVLVAENASGQLLAIDPFSMAPPVVRATGLSGPSGVAYDPVLDVAYVTEELSGELSRVTLWNGTVTLIASGLQSPVDVALDATGEFAYVISNSLFVSPVKVEVSSGTVTVIYLSLDRSWGIDLGLRPPPRLSVPDSLTPAPGASVPVDISLEGTTGLGILSADLTLEWNDVVLTANFVTPGLLAGGCNLTSNLTVPGRAVISVYCVTPRSGSGSLVTVHFNAIGQRGQGTPLRLANGTLNEGVPAVCLDPGSLEIPVTVDGRITYYRNAGTSSEPGTSAVPFVTVPLLRVPYDPFLNAGTACDGTYSFPSVSAGGGYQVYPYSYTQYAAAIDPFDASLNAQHVVGLSSLTPNQRLAADVTGNGTLSSLDSAKIAQYSVGIITQFPVAMTASEWAFVPTPQTEPNQTVQQPVPSAAIFGSISYTPLIESAEDQDFLGILFGDVSGNWTPPACLTGGGPSGEESLVASGGASLSKPTARVALPDLTTRPGATIQAPVTITGGSGLLSTYLDITWNPAILKWRGAAAGATGTGFSVTANGSEPGRVRLALYSVSPLLADGNLVVLSFDVIGKAGSRSSLKITEARINEGGIASDSIDGSVLVKSSRPKKR